MKKYFTFDDEYISGWQYFFRYFLFVFLCAFFVGFYLLSVNAYKRAKSLGMNNSNCIFYAIWGALLIFIAFIPIVNIVNLILHLNLWFSNGTPPDNELNGLLDEHRKETVKEYYDNRQLKCKGSFIIQQCLSEGGPLDCKGKGCVECFSPGDYPRFEHNYWEYFYSNGNLKMEGKFYWGDKTGVWKYYYENGKLESEGSWSNNKQDGLWKWYSENGELKKKVNLRMVM